MKFLKFCFFLSFFLTGIVVLIVLAPQVNAQQKGKIKPHKSVCLADKQDKIRCHAKVITNDKGDPDTTSGPTGYGPTQFQTAYNFNGASSSGRILAVVDAYDHPHIKSDLDVYSSAFNLPVLPLCAGAISASGSACFKIVDQNGGTNYPATDSGWALETSLDIEVAHAACPDCKLLLVEANSSSYSDLMTAIDRAVSMGANAISNSYGSNEFSHETLFDFHFNKPGIAFTFSSGDSGFGTSYPAASRYVTAVGGTSLFVHADNSYNFESVWSGTGSGVIF